MSQPHPSGMPPAAAAGAARTTAGEEPENRSADDDGVPVGAADAEADARRAGADVDDEFAGEASGAGLLGAGSASDGGVPVGSADADADRARASGDDVS